MHKNDMYVSTAWLVEDMWPESSVFQQPAEVVAVPELFKMIWKGLS